MILCLGSRLSCGDSQSADSLQVKQRPGVVLSKGIVVIGLPDAAVVRGEGVGVLPRPQADREGVQLSPLARTSQDQRSSTPGRSRSIPSLSSPSLRSLSAARWSGQRPSR